MQFDTIIIGAGAFGASLAFHLAQKGKRVALADRFNAASQTSARAAGMFKQIQSTRTRTQVAVLSIKKLLNFERETGVAPPAFGIGSLMVARNREHAAYVKREVAQANAWGANVELLDNRQTRERMPMLETNNLRAAAYSADPFVQEPTELLRAYLDACQARDVSLFENTPVTAINIFKNEVRGVTTINGELDAPVVVDAAGAWARAVALTGNANLPIVPVRHQLYVTHPIMGVRNEMPMIRFVDSAVYVRPSRGGLMVGGFEADPLPLDPRTRENFSMEQLPLDFSILENQTATIQDNIPALRDTTIQEHRGGLFTMTRDGQFLAGPMPNVRGLWALTGCNGSGYSSSLALGQVMAEWIVDGEPSIDLTEFSPARFVNSNLSDEELTAACVWQYAHYYDPTT